MSRFGPKNDREAEIFAATSLITRVQYEIEKAMKRGGLTQKDLADRLNVTPPRVNQMLNDNGNMTLRTLARIAHVLDLNIRLLTAESTIDASQDASRSENVKSPVVEVDGQVHPILLKRSTYSDDSVRQVMTMLRQTHATHRHMHGANNENRVAHLVSPAEKAVA